MKKDRRTFIDTKQDHTFSKPAATKVVDKTKEMLRLYLGRKGGYLPIFVMPNSKAVATVILLPGNDAELGQIAQNEPVSLNFMSRTRNDFFNENFNVIVVFRAEDLTSIDFNHEYRETEHAAEIAKVVEFADQQFKKPIWLISTSLGTISAVSTAINLDSKKIKGIVLTSTPASKYGEYIPFISYPIDKIKMPILMVHHSKDACKRCIPGDAVSLFSKFTSSTIKKFIMINKGSNPTGNTCLPLHWHGYINYEKETVKIISKWVKRPT